MKLTKKRSLYLILFSIMFLLGIVSASYADYKKVTVKCIEVVYTQNRYGKLYRHHYLQYPDGKVKSNDRGYFVEGKSYIIDEVTNPITQEAGAILIIFGLIGFIITILTIFADLC